MNKLFRVKAFILAILIAAGGASLTACNKEMECSDKERPHCHEYRDETTGYVRYIDDHYQTAKGLKGTFKFTDRIVESTNEHLKLQKRDLLDLEINKEALKKNLSQLPILEYEYEYDQKYVDYYVCTTEGVRWNHGGTILVNFHEVPDGVDKDGKPKTKTCFDIPHDATRTVGDNWTPSKDKTTTYPNKPTGYVRDLNYESVLCNYNGDGDNVDQSSVSINDPEFFDNKDFKYFEYDKVLKLRKGNKYFLRD